MKKLFRILVIMMLVLIGVKANAQNGAVYFYNGTTWTTNYRDPGVTGVAGDTLLMRYKNKDSVLTKVVWTLENPNTAKETPIDTAISCYGVIQPLNLAITYHVYNLAGDQVSFAMIGAKFIPSDLTIGKTGGKSTIEKLSLKNFNIKINSPTGGYKAYCDSVYWYRNDLLVHSGKDTLYNADLSGDYKIRAKLVYINVYGKDTNTFARYKISNTVNVQAVTTGINENTNNEVFKIYPNPTTDILYISEVTQYHIFSITGQEVLNGYDNKVDVKNLNKGIYFFKTNNGNMKKFLVE